MANKKTSKPLKKRQKVSFFASQRAWLLPVLIGLLVLIVAGGIMGFAGMQFEDHDAFCASCHTHNESDYYQRAQAATPVTDLATFHIQKQVRCIDCHSGSGLPGRVTAMSLGAKDLLAFISNHYSQPAPVTRPIADENCLKCHGNLTPSQDFNNHFHVFLSQWQARDPQAATCVDCHSSHSTTGQADIAFLNQKQTTAVCQRCHAAVGGGG